MSELQLFRSKQAEARYLTKYEELLNTWPTQASSTYVTTDFGETHILRTGNSELPAMVMIPGAQGTGAMWGPTMEALAEKRSIYCIDIVDQAGKSKPTEPLTNTRDSNLWLTQVLGALEIDQVDLVGNSIGCFIAARFASTYPDKIKTLTLTAPAATVGPINLSYVIQVLFALKFPGKFFKQRFLSVSSAGVVAQDDPLLSLLLSAMIESRNLSKLAPRPLREDEASKLTMPLLLIEGVKDKVNTSDRIVLGNQVRVEVFEDAGHLWSSEHLKRSGELIAAMLEGNL